MADPAAVSVIITTYERPDSCERALRSVLEQTARPLEVLVCDDGSRDETPARFQAWSQREPLVTYVRAPKNVGTPAATRNLGLKHARGAWVAFLDDDDAWLPSKLETQARMFADADVIGTNALRSTGTLYFPCAAAVETLAPRDLLRANPLILSSVVARKELLARAGGFPEERWARGVEDYGMWLALAAAGARMAVLGEPLAHYTDAPGGRLSDARWRMELAVSRLMSRELRRHTKAAYAAAALWHLALATVIAAQDVGRRDRGRAAQTRG